MADILIVEDDVELAATLGDLLALDGHSTRIAFNGEEGLQAMNEHLPDLIVLDVEMPVLDGPAMAYAALAMDIGRERIPVILSSGYPDLDDVADRLGTEYRMSKPCSIDALRGLIQRALDERHPPRPPQPVPQQDTDR